MQAANQPNGTLCTRARDCASFRCVDGVCCDTSCTGQCEACATGTCTPVVGPPVGNRPACTGSGPCAAACDGQTRTHCVGYPGAETSCANAACADGWQTTYGCGGNGTCHPMTTSCGLFLCNDEGTACLTTCASDGECVGAAHCANGVCQGDQDLGEPCTTGAECQQGHCANGVCCNEGCSEVCMACDVAGNVGFCTPQADDTLCDAGVCCSGQCVASNADPTNCGACGVVCTGGAACVNGICELQCLAAGGSCIQDDECCSQNCGGTCGPQTCGDGGDPCSSASDCCTTVCVNGMCLACLGLGESCGQDADVRCCSQNCGSNNTCEASLCVAQGSCTDDLTCCSQNCVKTCQS